MHTSASSTFSRNRLTAHEPVPGYKRRSPSCYRAERTRHWFELTIHRGASGAVYKGAIFARQTGRLLKRVTAKSFEDCVALLEREYDLLLVTPKATSPRRIHELADFLDAGVEARLKRRAEVFCKRYRLNLLSERYITTSIDNRPSMILRIVVEDLPEVAQ